MDRYWADCLAPTLGSMSHKWHRFSDMPHITVKLIGLFHSEEKDKDKEKLKERDKDTKEKDKDNKILNGHLFSAISTVGPISCYHCLKPFNKDSFVCANCGAIVHKSCKESVAACAKVKMKLQKNPSGLQPHDTSSLPTVIMRNKSSQPKERPRSAILALDENITTSVFNSRRSQQNLSLSKSVSIQNIAGGSDVAAKDRAACRGKVGISAPQQFALTNDWRGSATFTRPYPPYQAVRQQKMQTGNVREWLEEGFSDEKEIYEFR
ncbi:PREDICTED: A-kinase anchor protein 13-like [Thamnophis sirtalis]|uniref:A-kinase anchor protein 13-like n=1 Tax=Thamnophis sirtalis TaxID=35019 RepID=A0A6I9XZ03_9SAUR|nr:PREDICTED: A-kinase anchor protein 13-like [Thamnophis sirtalis]